MRATEFIHLLQERCVTAEDRKALAAGMPIGVDENGEMVLARKTEKKYAVQNTCVTGTRKTAFIKRLVLALSRLYTATEANFLVVSPYYEYGELLKLNGVDITVPFIRNKEDLQAVRDCLIKLAELYKDQTCIKFFLILDGLEELDGCNQNADLEEYRDIFDLLSRRQNVEIISGVELMKSIFSGYPGAFVGLGNCLVTTREHGKADVTYVDEDCSLSLPLAITYADLPTIEETVMAFNAENIKITGEDE